MEQTRSIRIVDSTLREGEQFAGAHFTTDDRLRIADALDEFGVDVIEMTSPAASPASARDLSTVAARVSRARVAAHVRCHLDDARLAVDHGAHAVHLLLGTSTFHRTHGHRLDLPRMIGRAREVLDALREGDVEVRFSCEDAFRTDPDDLMTILAAVDGLGVDRIGLADTVGAATPFDVLRVVAAVRATVSCDIEFHGHNDGGCAIANAHAAWIAGATHVDTTVLGIGERNGIASLSGFVARLYLTDPALLERYRLSGLTDLDRLVAERLGVDVPFNACITSDSAFSHKAGLHTHAVIAEPRTYEAIDPAAFGRQREILVGHRLTGRHAVADRAAAIGVTLDESRLRAATTTIKGLADAGPLAADRVDAVLRDAAAGEAS